MLNFSIIYKGMLTCLLPKIKQPLSIAERLLLGLCAVD